MKATRGVSIMTLIAAIVVVAIVAHAILFGLYLFADNYQPSPVTAVTQTEADNAQWCPHDGQATFDDIEQTSDSLALLNLVGPLLDIPEYHDCQRFIVVDTVGDQLPRYGPVFGIYVTYEWTQNQTATLPSFTIPFLDTIPTVQDSRTIDQTVSGQIRVPSAIGYTAAVIVAWGDYSFLGIRGPTNQTSISVNCLFLSHGGSGYSAVMVPLAGRPVLNNCQTALREDSLLSLGGTRLSVRPSARHSSIAREDIPPVARWEWDGANQYIGMACGSEWCEIGNASGGWISEPVVPPDPKLLPEVLRTRDIKGWYDRQVLAESSPNDSLFPSEVIGTIYPHPELGDRDSIDYVGRWVFSAEVALSAANSEYLAKLNLAAAAPAHFLGALNRIYMCTAAKISSCIGSDDALVEGESVADIGKPSYYAKWLIVWKLKNCRSKWIARIEAVGGGDDKYYCIARRPEDNSAHAGILVPKTARWHFVKGDEWTWVECDERCCEVCVGDPNDCF